MAGQNLLDSLQWHFRSWEELKSASIFTKINYTNITLCAVFLVIAVFQARNGLKKQKAYESAKHAVLDAPGFPSIEKLDGFKWEEAEPIKLRPFKKTYHLTMDDDTALENLDPNELILMDKNYRDRINYRRKIMKDHHDIVVAVNDERIRGAVSELFTFLMGTYLPTRYPSMFKVHHTEYEYGKEAVLENIVTGEILPTKPTRATATIKMLEILGRTLDEDFLFLLPSQDFEKDNSYILEAYMTVCPSGFNPREKLGKRLRDIHEPVPGYKQKLESSMDRYFAKMEVGKYVKRANWSLTTGAELYAANAGTHAYEGESEEPINDLDVDKRQTLHRLPRSNALVFAFKTYLYPIKELKEEGSGEELAQAIDGLKDGNVPAMHYYKRGAIWGDAAKRYLIE
ncbi:MAG: hypothetical protein Q9227_003565 [Pyrenula ochraceoflavens]